MDLKHPIKKWEVSITADINNSGHYVREFPVGNYTKMLCPPNIVSDICINI